MYSVYQHWDPLKTCIVGRSYPPEYYQWIENKKTRSLFEKIARETEEDYQNIIKKLEEFGVEVLRPELPSYDAFNKSLPPPPMNPRDYMVMIGDTLYLNWECLDFGHWYFNNKKNDQSCNSPEQLKQLDYDLYKEWQHYVDTKPLSTCYNKIIDQIKSKGNKVKTYWHHGLNGAMVSRLGKDLYFGTIDNESYLDLTQDKLDFEFPNTRNHLVSLLGHGDATYCPVCPGLIISLEDIPTYENTFPGWEVVYLPGQSWEKVQPFLDLKEQNAGKWWIPGYEKDQGVIYTVETWLSDWVGYVEETVFDVNMLIIDPKNVMVFNYNKTVFDALERYGITAHIVPFRHRYFWDGGIHCVTTDLNRVGTQQDFFPNRT